LRKSAQKQTSNTNPGGMPEPQASGKQAWQQIRFVSVAGLFCFAPNGRQIPPVMQPGRLSQVQTAQPHNKVFGGDIVLLTIQQVADRLQLSKATVRNRIKEGKLKAIKLGYNTLRVEESELEKFIRSLAQ
jgi:excisionase family DNA binding protein